MTKSYLKRTIKRLESELVNGKQAAKLAAKKIEELEHYNGRCRKDIIAYNKIVLGLIEGNLNPCEWCEENADCERPIKGNGCSEWWLAYNMPLSEEEKADDSERVSFVGSEGRA